MALVWIHCWALDFDVCPRSLSKVMAALTEVSSAASSTLCFGLSILPDDGAEAELQSF